MIEEGFQYDAFFDDGVGQSEEDHARPAQFEMTGDLSNQNGATAVERYEDP